MLATLTSAALAVAALTQPAAAVDYLGGWIPTPPKQQCVDICVNSKAAPTCLTNDPACLAKKQRPGDFDYLLLEQLFVPQFCRDLLKGVDSTISHQNVLPYPNGIACKPEVVKSEMTIHGLWPNYNDGYAGCCNVSDTISNHPYNAATFAKNQPTLLKKMAAKWIDPTQATTYDSLCEIYNHEFQKHGICYNAFGDNWEKSAVNYFQATLNVAGKLDSATNQINKWAATTKTTTVTAIKALYSKSVQVLCSNVDGTNQFSAIRSCFAKPTVRNSYGPFTQIDCAAASKSSAFIPCDESGKNPIDRFVAVVAWNISTLRPLTFGISPFNPILGETHHASAGSLNVLLEQISHHPPVSALHATDEKENLEMIWCQQPIAKFYGTSVEVEVSGKRELRLSNHRETYVMNAPNLMFKFLPTPGAEWSGNIRIACQDSGLEAELRCKGLSFFGFGGNARSIKGKIFDSFSSKPLYEVNGQWDRTITVKNIQSGEVAVIYSAKENIWRLRTPTVQDLRSVWPSESAVVWSEVSQGILNKDWEAAKRGKRALEEKQREIAREMASRGETWVPRHFTFSHTKEGGWDCTPIHKSVPPSPIVVPN